MRVTWYFKWDVVAVLVNFYLQTTSDIWPWSKTSYMHLLIICYQFCCSSLFLVHLFLDKTKNMQAFINDLYIVTSLLFSNHMHTHLEEKLVIITCNYWCHCLSANCAYFFIEIMTTSKIDRYWPMYKFSFKIDNTKENRQKNSFETFNLCILVFWQNR